MASTTKTLRRLGLGFGYLLSAVIIIFGTYFLVRLAQGNAFDIVTGKLKPTGLLLLDSFPNGAKIKVNNKSLKPKTPTRVTNIAPGSIHTEMTKAGFRSWQNDAQIVAGQVTFLTYAWLIPTTVPVHDHFGQLNPTALMPSPDHKHTFMAVSTPAPRLYVSDDLNSANVIYAPPDSADPSQKVSALTINAISDDGSNLLLTQTKPAGNEYVVVDSRGSRAPVNVTQLFRITAASLSFNPDNPNQLIWLDTTGVLRQINLSNQTISAVIADNVNYAIGSRGHFYFIQTTPTGRVLYSTDTAGRNKSTVLSSIEDSPTYQIEAANYNNTDFLAVYVGKTQRLSVYRDVSNNTTKTGDVLEHVTNFTFDKPDHFMSFVQDGQIASYDLDRNVYFHSNTPAAGLRNWLWLDDYHLVMVTATDVQMIDFDGQNAQVLYHGTVVPTLSQVNRNPIIIRATSPTTNRLSELFLTDKK